MKIEYSDFLPIWKDFLQGSDGVFNVQMVAHHFYNLGLSDKSEIQGKEFDEVIIDDPLNKQEPVAWMSPDGKVSTTEGKLFHIPLYTAPRELSNEEIIELTKDSSIFEYREFNDDMVRFAIAILRKAQEK
jgi:hypothetical protein